MGFALFAIFSFVWPVLKAMFAPDVRQAMVSVLGNVVFATLAFTPMEVLTVRTVIAIVKLVIVKVEFVLNVKLAISL